MTHTEIPLLLFTGSDNWAAETPILSVSMLRKLYDPRKCGFDDQEDLTRNKQL